MSAPPPPRGPMEVGVAHAEALAAIHRAAFREAEAWSAPVLAGLLAQPGCFALIDPAGGMLVARVTADEAEILTLAVAPAAQRGGLGSALAAAAMTRSAASGAVAMFLEVASTNTPARALYDKAGFVRVGRRARYYANGGDALVLRADLINPDLVSPGEAADG